MRLGCHLSIAGGLHKALELAQGLGLDAVAMFLRNQRQWRAPALTDTQVDLFKSTRQAAGISPVVAHGSYLVNLAGSGEFLEQSFAATSDEFDRCGRLGIEYLVIHPGSAANAQAGIEQLAELLSSIVQESPHEEPMILLEATAGQGNCLGHTFEQLADMLRLLEPASQFGVCLDTCHIFAAGYDIRTPAAYRETLARFDETIGLHRLRAIHLNDSMRELGSRVDRHHHVGQGKIGVEGLSNFVRDERFAQTPFILETPHGQDETGTDLDAKNVAAVRKMVE